MVPHTCFSPLEFQRADPARCTAGLQKPERSQKVHTRFEGSRRCGIAGKSLMSGRQSYAKPIEMCLGPPYKCCIKFSTNV